MPITPQQFRERYRQLPQELKDAIASEEASEVFWNIVDRLGIADDQAGALASLVNQTLAGFVPLGEFIPELKKRLNISEEEAKRIWAAFSAEVFAPIIPHLQALRGELSRKITPVVPFPQPPISAVEVPTKPPPPQSPPQPFLKPPVGPTEKTVPITAAPAPTVIHPAAPPPPSAPEEKIPVKEIRFAAPPKIEEVPKIITPGPTQPPAAPPKGMPVSEIRFEPMPKPPQPAKVPPVRPGGAPSPPAPPQPPPPQPSGPKILEIQPLEAEKPKPEAMPPPAAPKIAPLTPKPKTPPPGIEIIDLSTFEIRGKPENQPKP